LGRPPASLPGVSTEPKDWTPRVHMAPPIRDDSNLGTKISLSLLLDYHLLSWGLSSWLFLFWWFLHVVSRYNQLLLILWTYWHSDFKISMTYWLQLADGKCLMKHGSRALIWQFAISNQATDEPTIGSKSWTSDDKFQRRVCFGSLSMDTSTNKIWYFIICEWD
jgi:hypothetical protein